jgi:hypothetical protein
MRRHLAVLFLFAVLAVAWTWPLVLHLEDALAGGPGDNFSFAWNLWWMRQFLETPGLDYFHSTYLFHPFGVNIADHPHTGLPALIGATLLRAWSPVGAQNLLLIGYVFANMAAMYALAWDITRHRIGSVIGAVLFGLSPYVSVHLLGHFDLVAVWPLPLYALFLRRAIDRGSLGWSVAAGATLAVTAYVVYYYVVYLVFFTPIYVAAAARLLSVSRSPTPLSPAARRIALAGVIVAIVSAIGAIVVVVSGGGAWSVGSISISSRTPQNLLSVMWIGIGVCALAAVQPVFRLRNLAEARPSAWLLVRIAGTFLILVTPLWWQAAIMISKGEYVSQAYQWRSAPRGVDVLAPMLGHPLHPVFGSISEPAYARLGLDYIEGIGWFGLVPLALLLVTWRATSVVPAMRPWLTAGIAFGVWALGPLLTVGGFDTGLRLPAILLRFVPVVANARIPGRAIVIVFMVVAVLLAMAISTARGRLRTPAVQWSLLVLILFEYWAAPIQLTMLDRPAVYTELAKAEPGAVCEVPFGVGDGLSPGVGSQERSALWYATLHRHPLVGGYIGRMPPNVVERYRAMPIVGTLLSLSSGQEPGSPLADVDVAASPCRYLVVHRAASSAALLSYIDSLSVKPIAKAGDDELYRLH